MPQIQVLPKPIAELIAAGEVVERPSSVVKELVENAIDAGATAVTVELQRGGILYLRVTDNGCGISRGDVPTAFLRHATSKIAKETDLDAIATLGFRGEALASIAAVSRVEMLTRTKDDVAGTLYRIEGGEARPPEDAGCPTGTTVIVRDLFYNTPARMKFLKKDVTEGNAAAAVVDRIALSHPEISFRLLRDGKQTLSTPGDGSLESAVYAVLGRAFASTLIPVSHEGDGVSVRGLTCKPVACRPNRNGQYFFLNGRLVRSGTASAALEQAYKNSAMVGKFPACVLHLTLPPGTVDVNVHPSKMEVRFSDEHRVFDCVYAGVRTALLRHDTRPDLRPTPPDPRLPTAPETTGVQTPLPARRAPFRAPASGHFPERADRILRDVLSADPPARNPAISDVPVYRVQPAPLAPREPAEPHVPPAEKPAPAVSVPATSAPPETARADDTAGQTPPEVRYLGEAFSTYILVEQGDSLFLIDKHAAHERILYERFRRDETVSSQMLLPAQPVTLPKEEYAVLLEQAALLHRAGFEVENFGDGTLLVRAIPAPLSGSDPGELLSEIAGGLLTGSNTVQVEALDRLYHTVACRAAIKAGNHSTPDELLQLARQVLLTDDVRYCPHGRPVAFELKKRELEKHFGRL